MDGIEKITAKIAEDARREAEDLLAQAGAEADAILAQARAEAQRRTAELAEKGRLAADERAERLASVAQLDARKKELAAKQELLDRAFDRALERLCALEGKEQIALLAGLAAQASRTGTEQIILRPEDRARIGAEVVERANALRGASFTLAEETRPIRGGVLLADGRVETNCAFETLVRLQRESMAGEVAALLFG